MAGEAKDLREFLTAYEAREHLPELASWMDDDSLKGLTIWKGRQFVAGEEYFDLDNPRRGPFVATGDEGSSSDHTYVARGEASVPAWNRLITWQQPLSEDQAEAIQAQETALGPGV